MKFETSGILIAIRPFGDRDSVARVFTPDNGVISGMLRGGAVARRKPMAGQYGGVTWIARLDSQLGVMRWDTQKNYAAPLFSMPMPLMQMNAAFELIAALVPERESFPRLYDETICLLSQLAAQNTDAYLTWEIALLRELGYALDLSRCAGCGRGDDLKYLSPRTGRAVCADCGAQYASRMWNLPLGLKHTGEFIARVCADLGIEIPRGRKLLS